VINNFGQPLNVTEIVSALQEIVEQSEEMGPPVGILTTDNRNNWGKAYQDLILGFLFMTILLLNIPNLILDLDNLKSAREIQTSLFLVCLDNPMPHYDGNKRTTASKQLIHGGGTYGNSANRWYDKTVQVFIFLF
jgi:carnitine O-acetyltransferase